MSRGRVSTYWERREKLRQERRTALIEQQREAERQRQEGEQNAHRQQIVASLQSIHDDNEADSQRDHAKQHHEHIWERRRFWLDVAAVLVAAFAAYILFGQLNAMNGQLGEMQAEQRPFIFVKQVSALPGTDQASKAPIWYFGFRWENSGNNPPKHLVLYLKCGTVKFGSEPAFNRQEIIATGFRVERLIGPKQDKTGGSCP